MSDPTAVLGRRYLAYIIDGVLAAVVVLIIAGSTFFGSSHTISTGGDPSYCSNNQVSGQMCFQTNDNQARVISTGSLVGSFYGSYGIVWLLNMVLLEGLVGGTVGKLACGIRVVKHDGSICGVGRALVRNLLLIVDGFCFALVGIITSSTTKGHRRVGDMAASTLVVAKSQLGTPVNIPGLTAPAYGGYSSYAGSYPPASGGYGQVGGPSYPAGSAYGQVGGPYPSAGESAPAPAQPEYQADTPTWDAKRNAYIQYDTARGTWLEHDTVTGEWKPISQ
jgi:uncharacterized RDD family membrane protein YckC